MKLFKNIFNKEYDFRHSLTAIALLALFLTFFQIILQNGLSEFCFQNYLGYLKSPLLLIFNFLPIFLLMTLFYFLLNSISKSFIIINIPLTLLLIINHYKIFFRDAPLTVNDFFASREALSIVQNYKLQFDFKIFFGVVLITALSIILVKFLHNQKNKVKIRILGSLLSLFLIALSYFLIYENTDLYKNVSTPQNEYYDVDIVRAKGLIYSLLSKESVKTVYIKPANYSDKKMNALLTQYSNNVTENKELPNVIAIMSEAFFDIKEAENLEFYPNKNPLTNYEKLKKDSYYGNIIVPGFAGATASTEFEFLTGINISNFAPSMPDVYKTHINSKIYSLVSLFKELKYKAIAIHPGFSWFYNRNSVYKYMGFDDMIFKSDLPKDTETINYYISDKVTSNLIIDNYKKHLAENNENGYFNFTVTIQNHGPYSSKDLDDPYIKKPDNMDEELYNIVNNYIKGLDDADKLLGDVTNFVSTLDTPTVIVFFGDHLPYFDSDLQSYKDIGYPITENTVESLKLKYSTPYIIWGNDAAKSLIHSQGGTVLNGKSEDISSNYLGLKLLQYINMDLPPFFNFINELKNKIPIISKDYYYTNNTFKNTLSGEYIEKLKDYEIWTYFNLMKQK